MMPVLALDVGGANLKIADGAGYARSVPFPLWQRPHGLAHALAELIRVAPLGNRFVATMTGELADCFSTKSEGVAAIVSALQTATVGAELRIYLTDGTFVAPSLAIARPLAAAASNWHALASFVARRYAPGYGLLIDVGSTTCDIIPLVDGQAQALGRTDPERLAAGELVYTGVVRSPVCAMAAHLPWRGQLCPTAHEVFATTRDAYLVLGDIAEDPSATDTADGRPATRSAARDRLARAICADRDMFSEDDAIAAAETIRRCQVALLESALQKVLDRMSARPTTIVLSGQGEFLARYVPELTNRQATIISLASELGPVVSQCATAHALAALAG
ncbi:MAG TPA: hydantoinase/oxoprolinase family protein [Pirellulales bacterium]|jgi:hypothetical protein